jgi:hypothetical protein
MKHTIAAGLASGVLLLACGALAAGRGGGGHGGGHAGGGHGHGACGAHGHGGGGPPSTARLRKTQPKPSDRSRHLWRFGA